MVVTVAHSCATSVLVGGAGSGFFSLPYAALNGCNLSHFTSASHWGEGVVGSNPAAPTIVSRTNHRIRQLERKGSSAGSEFWGENYCRFSSLKLAASV